MKKSLSPLNWQDDIKTRFGVEIQMIDDDFVLLDKVNILPEFRYPFKLDVTTVMICTKGTTHAKIGLKRYEMPAPCIVTLLADEIIQNEYVSDDFEGLFIVMSKRLTAGLNPNARNRVPIALSVRENPFIPLNDEELDLLKNYYSTLKRTVEVVETQYCKKIVRLFMKSFYYLLRTRLIASLPLDKEDNCAKQFLELVETHYKKERQIGFYASQMHLTPKYLSRIIKNQTRKSANDWIDGYVMLEAKALLKSSTLSIQQISEALNFVDQSVFGRYFKRHERISPKEYRKK
jgi:AraC-like DNA-binding protein